jgi:hypothetical protein
VSSSQRLYSDWLARAGYSVVRDVGSCNVQVREVHLSGEEIPLDRLVSSLGFRTCVSGSVRALHYPVDDKRHHTCVIALPTIRARPDALRLSRQTDVFSGPGCRLITRPGLAAAEQDERREKGHEAYAPAAKVAVSPLQGRTILRLPRPRPQHKATCGPTLGRARSRQDACVF